ncbi:unnamed protein product [Musa acuminata subsp. burmannicoides]
MLFHINVMRLIRILDPDRRRCINELCTLIQTLEQLLFSSSTTAEPLLTPRVCLSTVFVDS